MRTVPMQADLFNAIANQRALPAVSRAEAVQLLASLLYEVQQTQVRQPANVEAGHEQDQR
jgi:HD-like signal output (HDOD) protein